MKLKNIYLSLFAMLLGLWGCSNEHSDGVPMQEDEVTLKLLLNADNGYKRSMTRALESGEEPSESQLSDVSILVFDNAGNRDFLYSPDYESFNGNTGELIVKLKKTSGNNTVDVAILANSKDYLTISDISNYQDLIDKVSYDITDLEVNKPMPFFGVTRNISVVTNMVKSFDIDFIRSIARVSVQIDPIIPESDFKLEEAYLYNANKKAKVAFSTDDSGKNLPNIDTDINSNGSGSIEAINQKVGRFYLAEAAKEQAFLIIKGKYRGNDAFYKLALPAIERNYEYIVNVNKIYSSGFGSLREAIEGKDETMHEIIVFDEPVLQAFYTEGNYFGINAKKVELNSTSKSQTFDIQSNIDINNIKQLWDSGNPTSSKRFTATLTTSGNKLSLTITGERSGSDKLTLLFQKAVGVDVEMIDLELVYGN